MQWHKLSTLPLMNRIQAFVLLEGALISTTSVTVESLWWQAVSAHAISLSAAAPQSSRQASIHVILDTPLYVTACSSTENPHAVSSDRLPTLLSTMIERKFCETLIRNLPRVRGLTNK